MKIRKCDHYLVGKSDSPFVLGFDTSPSLEYLDLSNEKFII